ncbi:MAG: hypothetical protein QM786_09105 [Breznakibacter sp.]
MGIGSFFLVLFTMPLGHALMILMEHLLTRTALHYSAFAMGAVGLGMVITGVFVQGDTRQTLWGFFGGLLFWTGWVEFMFVYYARRFGVAPLLDEAGEIVTKPEYLILPASFGFWAMFVLIYLFSVKTGCDFFNWLQKIFFRNRNIQIEIRPMARHVSIVTFIELNLILWTSYLLLMFCYDDHFIGDRHPVTALVAFGSLVGSAFMFRRLLKIGQWGYSIRYSIPTVIVFWTFVEVLGRWDLFREIWVEPMQYKTEMLTMLIALAILLGILLFNIRKKRDGKKRT